MTSAGLDKKIVGSIPQFEKKSLSVLKIILGHENDDTPEADMAFLNGIDAFFRNPRNIWRRFGGNGDYINTDMESILQRARIVSNLSTELGMDIDQAKSMITRIMESVPRALNRNTKLLQQIYASVHGEYVVQDGSEPTVEQRMESGEDVSFEDIVEAFNGYATEA